MKKNRRQGGFIKIILLIVIVLIVLGYFGYDIRDIVNSPTVKENLATFWGWIVTAYYWLKELISSAMSKVL